MKSFWKHYYGKLGDDTSDTDSPEEQGKLIEKDQHDLRHRFAAKTHAITFAFTLGFASALILTIILGGIIYSFSHAHSTSSDENPKIVRKCGHTAAEAMALGCTFDHMTWSWLSPKCPRYASDDFLAAEEKPWNYYQDPDNRVLVSKENWTLAMDNQIRLYTERRERITHCVFTFLNLAQIIRDGKETHPKLSSYGHIKHCAEVTLESVRRDREWWKVDADMGKVSFDEGC
jgi:hypothetical protein